MAVPKSVLHFLELLFALQVHGVKSRRGQSRHPGLDRVTTLNVGEHKSLRIARGM